MVRAGVLAAVMVLAASCGSTAKTATPPSTGTQRTFPQTISPAALTTVVPTTTTTVPPTTTTVPGLGSTLTVADGFGATITLLTYGPLTAAESYFGLKPGQVEVTVKGCSGSMPISFNPLYFNLIDSENDKIRADLAGSRTQIDSADVAPGDCVKGSVVFTLASGLTGKALEFSTALGSLRARWSLT